jgi:hypothetical protein
MLVQPATVERWHRDWGDRRWCVVHDVLEDHPSMHGIVIRLGAWPRELALGRAADSRRITETRSHRLRTPSVALPSRTAEEAVTDLAHIPGKSSRPVHMQFHGAGIVRRTLMMPTCPAWHVPNPADTRSAVRPHQDAAVDWRDSLQRPSQDRVHHGMAIRNRRTRGPPTQGGLPIHAHTSKTTTGVQRGTSAPNQPVRASVARLRVHWAHHRQAQRPFFPSVPLRW